MSWIFLALTALLAGYTVEAQAVEAFRVRISPGETRVHGPFYEVNAALGRARLAIAIGDYPGPPSGGGEGAEPPSFIYREGLVPGMRYDQGSRTVFWNDVPCAQLTAGDWPRVVPTGRCKLSIQLLDSTVDDGFTLRPVRHAVVSIDTL